MNATIARITLRGLLGRRRALLLIPLPLVLIGLVLIGRASGEDPQHWAQPVLAGFGFAVVLPLTALIVGTSVLGAEIDDGTLVHILTKPIARSEIVLTKLAVAFGVTTVAGALPLLVAGLITDSARLGIAMLVAGVIGSLAYSAVFLALSLLTRRPVVIGLLYVLLWEGLLGNLLAGTRVLSIQQYMVTIADRIASSDLLTGRVSLPVAAILSAAFVVAATVLAIDRLRSFSLAGDTS
jgi:ABC-2 type transport system permease protein